jgi:phospholipase B1
MMIGLLSGISYSSRPDEISVVMAIGDSITAGLFARPASDDLSRLEASGEVNQHFFPGFKGFQEYRGVSFSTGGDADAVTLANVSPAHNAEYDRSLTLVG